MNLDFSPETKQKIKSLTSITGVLKKKREKGTITSLISASDEKWFCFRCDGRFFVHYEDKKKPVLSNNPIVNL